MTINNAYLWMTLVLAQLLKTSIEFNFDSKACNAAGKVNYNVIQM